MVHLDKFREVGNIACCDCDDEDDESMSRLDKEEGKFVCGRYVCRFCVRDIW